MLPALEVSKAVGFSTEPNHFDDVVEFGLWPAYQYIEKLVKIKVWVGSDKVNGIEATYRMSNGNPDTSKQRGTPVGSVFVIDLTTINGKAKKADDQYFVGMFGSVSADTDAPVLKRIGFLVYDKASGALTPFGSYPTSEATGVVGFTVLGLIVGFSGTVASNIICATFACVVAVTHHVALVTNAHIRSRSNLTAFELPTPPPLSVHFTEGARVPLRASGWYFTVDDLIKWADDNDFAVDLKKHSRHQLALREIRRRLPAGHQGLVRVYDEEYPDIADGIRPCFSCPGPWSFDDISIHDHDHQNLMPLEKSNRRLAPGSGLCQEDRLFLDKHANYTAIAAAESKMFEFSKNGQGVIEVPVPAVVRATGRIPEGYSVDFILDPITVVSALAKKGVTTEDQLFPELVDGIKAQVNAPRNLNIVPTSLYEQKLATVLAAHEADEDANEDVSDSKMCSCVCH
ncbi:hypothetical protein FPV67DRAFT_1456560 [Lyophyllum atratum]|nr:hypothetical protein FPV67DRAFT_1456560 [Lyophyllum atratum]